MRAVRLFWLIYMPIRWSISSMPHFMANICIFLAKLRLCHTHLHIACLNDKRRKNALSVILHVHFDGSKSDENIYSTYWTNHFRAQRCHEHITAIAFHGPVPLPYRNVPLCVRNNRMWWKRIPQISLRHWPSGEGSTCCNTAKERPPSQATRSQTQSLLT